MIKHGIITTADQVGCRPMQAFPLGRSGIDRQWLRKRGSVLEGAISGLKPREGMSAIYILPISAMEVTGSNRNGDYWPETGRLVRIAMPGPSDPKVVTIRKGLKEQHPTFVTKAKMYRDHENEDPEKASGEIVSCVYNEPLGRAEAIGFVDNKVWDHDLHRLSQNQNIGVSMSARVPFDVCICCGNKAKSRLEYCSHIRNHMNAILREPMGLQVGVINEEPEFFDISGVRFNADRLGFGLSVLPLMSHKAASADLRRRRDVVRKLAAMEKRIESEGAVDVARSVDARLMGCPSGVTVSILKSYGPGMVGRALRRKKIMLGPEGFLKVVGDDQMGAERMASRIRPLLPKVFQMLEDEPAGDLACAIEPAPVSIIPPGLMGAIRRMAPDLSIEPQRCEARLLRSEQDFPAPPRSIRPVKETECGEDEEAVGLAKEYGKYLLSLTEDDPDEKGLTVVVAKGQDVKK